MKDQVKATNVPARTVPKPKFDVKRLIFIVLFLLMPTLNFLIFYVYVNFDGFLMAFQFVEKGVTNWGFMHFDTFFADMASDNGELKLALINSLKTWVVTFVMFPISFFVSVFIFRKIIGGQLFRVIFQLPGLISGTVVASVYIMWCNNTGYGTEYETVGILSRIVQNMFDLDYAPALLGEERWANTFVFVNIIWLAFPGDLIIWGGTLSRIPDSVIESANLDGANWWQETWKIIIPMVWPTVALKMVLMTTGILGAGGNVFLLTNKGAYGTQTISNWMYMQTYNQGGYLKNSNALNYMSAVGICFTVVTALIVIFVQWITKKMDSEVQF